MLYNLSATTTVTLQFRWQEEQSTCSIGAQISENRNSSFKPFPFREGLLEGFWPLEQVLQEKKNVFFDSKS